MNAVTFDHVVSGIASLCIALFIMGTASYILIRAYRDHAKAKRNAK